MFFISLVDYLFYIYYKKGFKKDLIYYYRKMPFKDKEKLKEYSRQYYLNNKDKWKCKHNRKKSICIECGGGSICEHQKQKRYCKECGGSGICEHKKRKSRCVECEGSEICEHNKRKSTCVECKGSQICEHNKRKERCVECKGSQICEHQKIKSICKECGGGSICEHNRQKSQCKECGGSSICEHNKQKYTCIECGGNGICEHNRQKSQCKECNIFGYLVHLQRKRLYTILRNNNNISKTKPTIEYLDCSAEFFVEWIKNKFVDGMTFDNIHLDHIKPVTAFDLEDPDELLKCCHYSNFQPLLVCDNLQKSNKWSEEDNIFWNENIIYKDYTKIYLPV